MKSITIIEPAERKLKKTRVAAYCRVSTAMDEQLISLKTQKTHYEQYIRRHPGWELAGLYYDEGISGTKKETRPALLQMISDCEKGLEDLLSYVNHAEMSPSFNGELVARFVEKIEVYSREAVTFNLKCGLKLKQMMR